MGATIAIAADGTPAVAYVIVDPWYSIESVYYYSDGTSTQVSSDVSFFVDLSIGPDGFARMLFENGVFWNSSENAAMNFIQCTNTSCSSAVANSLSVPSEVSGTYGSVAVTADGTSRLQIDSGGEMGPASSYLLLCTAADCSSYATQEISAVAGDSAGIASLVMATNNTPTMIAQDANGIVYQVQTSVSATISQNTTGNVSLDDAKDGNYENQTGTYSLGNIIETGLNKGCGIGIETVGTLSPSSYTSNVIIRRVVVSSAVYQNSTYGGVAAPPGQDDTSYPEYQDQDPQSGGSNGKVYDLDVPTETPRDSNTYRIRLNFRTYAALSDGTPISQNYYFYVRLFCTQTASGYQFVNDIASGNQTGQGSSNTSWNLH